MAFPLRVRALASRWLVPVVFAGLSAGCMGRVDPGVDGPQGPGSSSGSGSGGVGSSSGSGSGSGSSSGSSSGAPSSSSSSGGPSPGDPDCSILAVPDIARVCPDGTSVGGEYELQNHQCVLEFPCPPPVGGCSQGGLCQPGNGCASASSGAGDNPGCESTCMCDGTGHYQCSTTCAPPSCSQGAQCSPGTACGGGSSSGGGNSGNCTTSCKCDQNGLFECATVCQPPPIMNPCPGLAVPDICQICSNGTTECAHAILLKGVCQIEICP